MDSRHGHLIDWTFPEGQTRYDCEMVFEQVDTLGKAIGAFCGVPHRASRRGARVAERLLIMLSKLSPASQLTAQLPK